MQSTVYLLDSRAIFALTHLLLTWNILVCFLHNRDTLPGNQHPTSKWGHQCGFHIIIQSTGPLPLLSAGPNSKDMSFSILIYFYFLEPLLILSLSFITLMDLKLTRWVWSGCPFLYGFFPFRMFSFIHVSVPAFYSLFSLYLNIETFIIQAIVSVQFYGTNYIHIVVQTSSQSMFRNCQFSLVKLCSH